MAASQRGDDHSLAHNLVVVDQLPQERTYGGHTRLYKKLPSMTVFQAEVLGGYKQVTEYNRTMLLINTPSGNAYAVDAPSPLLSPEGV